MHNKKEIQEVKEEAFKGRLDEQLIHKTFQKSVNEFNKAGQLVGNKKYKDSYNSLFILAGHINTMLEEIKRSK